MRLLSSGFYAPKVFELGIKPIRESTRRAKIAAQNSFALVMVPLANRMYEDLLGRFSQPLQSVRSYTLYKRIYGPPFRGYGGRGIRIGHFSRRAPSIKGTAWESQAQVSSFTESPHGALRNLLSRSVTTAGPAKVIAEIGYPPEVSEHRGPYRYIAAVLKGTPVMQGRPALSVLLRQYRSEFMKLSARQMRETFERFGRRFPVPTAQLQRSIDRDFEAIAARQQFLASGLTQPSITSPGFRGRSGVAAGANRTVTQSIRRLRRRIARNKAELAGRQEAEGIKNFITDPLARRRFPSRRRRRR